MTRAANALTPGADVVAERDPPAMEIGDNALAPAGVDGNACEILTAVLDVCVSEIWDPDLSVRHTECIGRGDERCAWRLVDMADADPVPSGSSGSGTRAAS